ncbi:hypothetical protein F4810DRAFT_454675 [Camillea tinctor]|nr:hypothetical protein F4810DRAFT_454675 [Camillea tinctor]
MVILVLTALNLPPIIGRVGLRQSKNHEWGVKNDVQVAKLCALSLLVEEAQKPPASFIVYDYHVICAATRRLTHPIIPFPIPFAISPSSSKYLGR